MPSAAHHSPHRATPATKSSSGAADPPRHHITPQTQLLRRVPIVTPDRASRGRSSAFIIKTADKSEFIENSFDKLGVVSTIPHNPQHLIGAALKLVRYRFDSHPP